jgi:hypothetical protein
MKQQQPFSPVFSSFFFRRVNFGDIRSHHLLKPLGGVQLSKLLLRGVI